LPNLWNALHKVRRKLFVIYDSVCQISERLTRNNFYGLRADTIQSIDGVQIGGHVFFYEKPTAANTYTRADCCDLSYLAASPTSIYQAALVETVLSQMAALSTFFKALFITLLSCLRINFSTQQL